MTAPAASPRERLRRPDLAAAILACFLVLACVYVWVIPPGYGPDEPRHFAYVRRLAEKGELPIFRDGAEADGAHTLHPPLYYAVLAPVYLAARPLGERGALLVLRHLSPLLLLAALLVLLDVFRRLFPGQPGLQAAALAFTALLPEFLLEAAVVNNDGGAILLAALYLRQLVVLLERPPSLRDAVVTGLILAALVNTKAIGWTLAPVWLLCLWFRRRRHSPRLLVRDAVAAYAVLAALGTWWYARSYALYGQAFQVALPGDPMVEHYRPRNTFTREPLTALEVYTKGEIVVLAGRSTLGLFQSFWAQVDWIPVAARPWVAGVPEASTLSGPRPRPYPSGVLLVLVLGPLVRAAYVLARRFRAARRGEPEPEPDVPPLALAGRWLLGWAFGLAWLNAWSLATFVHLGVFQGGRYLIPVAAGAAVLLTVGWASLLPARARPWLAPAAMALFLGLNALCLNELVTVLNPQHARPWP